MSEEKLEGWEEVGRVVHYFGNIEVAVIKFSDEVEKGDRIRIVGGVDTDFEQKVKSMEVDHEKTDRAGKGDEAGVKVKNKVREGYRVYKE